MIENIAYIFIIIGFTFDFFGCLGLIRLPDVYNRLQAATKSVTLGTCSILFGLFLFKGFSAAGIKALLCIVFLILTSPVAAHALARGAHKSGVKLYKGSVCDKYADEGLNSLENTRVLQLKPFSEMGTPIEIINNVFGGKDEFDKAVRELEKELYSEESAA